MKKVGILSLAIVLALGTVGVGYAMWDKTLAVEAVVLTGEVNAEFVDAFTDDDGFPNDENIDPLDNGSGDEYNHWGPESSNDPLASQPLPPRGPKDVGRSFAEITGPDTAQVVIENGYPCYYSTAYFVIHNSGSIPVKVQTVWEHCNVDHWVSWDGGDTWVLMPASTWYPVVPCTIKLIDFGNDGIPDVAVHVTGTFIGEQIDPCNIIIIDLDFHVLQGAGQLAEYVFDEMVELVQWNEFEPLQ
ncbi:MAG TPA: hypothetical protein G4O07_02820 [Dehalococcoidia bacterium]|nr:hypothetical protein [Dehalococcoidia bacterium]